MNNKRTIKPLPPTPAAKKLILILIILLGVFFRIHQINAIPPGDGFDPAYYGLDAQRILSGETPIYLATNFGREVMFSYLVAASYLIFGSGTLGIHMASALVAIFTIPAVYLVAHELFRAEKSGTLRQYGGLLAALIIALSYWHLSWSRYSVRAILIPLFISLTLFFLLRGLRTRRRQEFVITGLLLGISLYTYQLAQLFPILVVLAFVYDTVAHRSFSRQDGIHLGLVLGTAFILWLPLGYYAWIHPDVFNQRIGDVFILNKTQTVTEQVRVLLKSIQRVLMMFTVQGDMDPLINIPGRPSLNPFLSTTLIAAILMSLWRLRHPRTLFLLSWLIVMSSPAFLADKAAMSKRAIGVLPAVAILITLGLLLPWQTVSRWRAKLPALWAKGVLGGYTAVIAAGLIFTGTTTFRDYFITWGTNPSLYTHYNAGVAEIGKYIRTLPPEELIYLSPTWLDHATLQLHSNLRPDIHAYNGRHCFIFPQHTNKNSTYIIVPGDEGTSLPLLTTYFPQGQVAHEGVMGNGEPYFTAYQIPANTTANFAPQYPLAANWDNQINMLGFDLETDMVQAGQTLSITLYYQPLVDMSFNYTIFMHLLGPPHPDGNPIWGQEDREPCYQSYATSSWRMGEIIRDTFTIPIAPDAMPGEYQLTTGIYKWPELMQLPLISATSKTNNHAITLAPIQLQSE